jgi:16S rRNA processing protein RimM
MNTDHVKIGTIVSKHGYKGFIKINVSSFNFEQLPDIKHLFIDINNCFVPFMIEEIKSFSNNLLILKFSEVNSEEEADDIILKNIFIESKNYKTTEQKGFFYDELIRFNVYNQSKRIGVIERINIELPQPVFEVLINSKIVMIPIHEDLIDKIDKKNNIIHIDIPDGLIEII